MAGRGSFIESFPLFGYDLADYDQLFEEKLELLLQLRERAVTWAGATAPLDGSASTRGRCRSRCRCGSRSAARPQSAVRAGALGLPMALAIIGGLPERFAPVRRDPPPRGAPSTGTTGRALSINSHGFVAETLAAGGGGLLRRR